MTSSFIETEISLHQFLLHQPPAEVGKVIAVFVKNATVIEQINSVAFSQSQGGAQGNSIVGLRNFRFRKSLGSISSTKNGAVYLKINVQISGRGMFNSREIEMVNPR